MTLRLTTVRCAAAALCLALGLRAAAEEHVYSEYEQETVTRTLRAVGGHVDPSPEGKTIEAVEIVSLEVIEDRDPAPGFLNWFHTTTREAVVRRELLVAEGDRYDQRLVDETERNLRDFRQLSIVLAVPLRGSEPDRVRLLVITKDIWSLRLNSNFRLTDGKLEFLLLQPSEENLAGLHQTVATQFIYEPDTLSFGARFIDPRLGGEQLVAFVDANVIVSRGTGDAEGSFGSVGYGHPLVSTETEWAWDTRAAWRTEIFRRFVGLTQDTFDAVATAGDDRIPYEYDSERLFWQTSVTRSFGRRYKNDVSVGLETSRQAFSFRSRARFAPAAVREFEREEIPTSDTRIGPFLRLESYTSDFHRTLDFATLGLQEDIRLGHQVVLKAYPAFDAAKSSRTLLGTYAGLLYTLPFGNGAVRPYVTSNIEIAAAEARSDGQVETGLHVSTPTLSFLRLVYDGGVLHRYRDYLNRRFTLGGEGRLRGYRTRAFVGKDVVASNLELRTRSIQILTVQLGGAVFWDAGDAFDGFDDLEIKHGAGIGARAAFPQLDRIVGRLDVAFPLSRFTAEESAGMSVVLTFGQAFDMPQLMPLDANLSGSVR